MEASCGRAAIGLESRNEALLFRRRPNLVYKRELPRPLFPLHPPLLTRKSLPRTSLPPDETNTITLYHIRTHEPHIHFLLAIRFFYSDLSCPLYNGHDG